MWGNRYFSWVGSKFTEGVVQRKIKGGIGLAFLECLFYNNTGKNMWGNRYFSWDGSTFTERGNLNKTWDYRGADTRTIVPACGKVRPCKLSGRCTFRCGRAVIR